ncbi:uncharacterized protein B0H18DRAFT_1120924 [Fomitopsis serialis]|uniref:uncharacterized protein n=1 Tax=Fomitopsis serialis TaxID=139415 RepID=UPI0020077716|nr:uncharacterized protein B0H18DRAFT_1120924 [Neoantrodia serialis]KAH9922363.1 hypothetical protein B0H18DRAFT_1120924 [Neoantrodia serialis]
MAEVEAAAATVESMRNDRCEKFGGGSVEDGEHSGMAEAENRHRGESACWHIDSTSAALSDDDARGGK